MIAREGLGAGVWFADPRAAPNRVVVDEVDSEFRVHVTSERGSAEGIRYFDDESEAFKKYVRLLRVQQRILDRGVL